MPVADIRISDPVVKAIVEHYQAEASDSTPTKTAGRIIQAFHAAGMRLMPVSASTISAPSPGPHLEETTASPHLIDSTAAPLTEQVVEGTQDMDAAPATPTTSNEQE